MSDFDTSNQFIEVNINALISTFLMRKYELNDSQSKEKLGRLSKQWNRCPIYVRTLF